MPPAPIRQIFGAVTGAEYGGAQCLRSAAVTPTLPPPPACSFASDNAAGADPVVLAALAAANDGPALAYGDDHWTRTAVDDVRACFGAPAEVLFCWSGTGTNVVALASVLRPWQAVVTVGSAHIVGDEVGGPARFSGATVVPVPPVDGKLTPDAVAPYLAWIGVERRPQPRVLSVSQVTEAGTVYTVDELAALGDLCRRHDLLLHVDGARLANAVVATGADPRTMLRDTGVDLVSFGLTKDGALFAEAVVYLDPALGAEAAYHRKQAGQLVSKSRFTAVQFSALLAEDRWLANARVANDAAARLAGGAAAVAGVTLVGRPEANIVHARVPLDRLGPLLDWSFFWVDEPSSTARWVTSFVTTDADVDTFLTALRATLA